MTVLAKVIAHSQLSQSLHFCQFWTLLLPFQKSGVVSFLLLGMYGALEGTWKKKKI